MVPGPTLAELVDSVRGDTPNSDALQQLQAAVETVGALTDVGDAVLGFFVDQCRRSGKTWAEISDALGVTRQAAHKRYNESDKAIDLFTPRAQAALFAATQEAQALGHNYVGTEHLLLGLFDPSEGLAALVLSEATITRTSIIERIKAIITTPPMSTAVASTPHTPRATQCIVQATHEALSLGHNYVGTEHLLLAVAAQREGLAARILADLGCGYDELRAAVITKLSGFAHGS